MKAFYSYRALQIDQIFYSFKEILEIDRHFLRLNSTINLIRFMSYDRYTQYVFIDPIVCLFINIYLYIYVNVYNYC